MRHHARMPRRLVLAVLAALVLGGSLAACGSGDEEGSRERSGGEPALPLTPDPADRGKTIRIGSKDFTESVILANVYGQALEAAGYTVDYALELGDEAAATRALRRGRIDAYPEYTGTALIALLGVDPEDVPKDETEAYEEARRLYAERLGLLALPQTPFTDSNALGMTAEKAAELGDPRTISDLAREHDGELTLAASRECFRREDCALGLREVYGLRFKRRIVIDVAERHEVILDGRADLTIPFTTDGQIAANDEVVLEDDKDLFPPYNVTFVLTKQAAERLGPNLRRVVTAVQEGLTTPVMQELNSRVDLDRQDPRVVARQYLQAEGYVR